MRQIAQPPVDTPNVTARVRAVKTKVGKRVRGGAGEAPGEQALQQEVVWAWAMSLSTPKLGGKVPHTYDGRHPGA
jgi:hypothetical protein